MKIFQRTYKFHAVSSFMFCLLSAGVNAQVEKTDLAERHLYGDVADVHETYYKAVKSDSQVVAGKKLSDRWFYESISHYDDAGMETYMIQFDATGDTVSRRLNYYDAMMNLIGVEMYYPGRSVEKVEFHCTYDGIRVKENTWINPYGSFRGKETFQYDSAGNVSDKSWYDSDTHLTQRQTWKYDKGGLVTETIKYGADGKPRAKHNYTNDDLGRLSEELAVDGKGKFLVRYVYEYNEKGFLCAERSLDQKGKQKNITTWEYTYDASGNWTKRISWIGKKPWQVTVRTITYR